MGQPTTPNDTTLLPGFNRRQVSSILDILSKWLDDRCRRFDMESQRLCAGPLTHWGIHRENFEAFLWPGLIAAAMWTGMPTFNRLQLVGIAIGLLTLGILIFLNRVCSTPRGDLLAQVLLLFALGVVVFIFGPSEAGTGFLFYRHVLIPVVLIVGLVLLLSCLIATQLLRPLQERSRYGEYMKRTELFQSGGVRLPLANREFPRAILIVISILLRPLELLWPSAIAILISPPAYLNISALIVFCIVAQILFLAALNERFDNSNAPAHAPLHSQRWASGHHSDRCLRDSAAIPQSLCHHRVRQCFRPRNTHLLPFRLLHCLVV